MKFGGERKEITCTVMQVTQWLEPLDSQSHCTGREQFLGRSVSLRSGSSITPCIVIGVVSHSNKWSVVPVDEEWTCCNAQELLVWMDPLQTHRPRSSHPRKALSSKSPEWQLILTLPPPPLVSYDGHPGHSGTDRREGVHQLL